MNSLQKLDARKILEMKPDGWEAQVNIEEETAHSTRLAESAIVANTSVRDASISLTVAKDNQLGSVTITSRVPDEIRKSFKTAVEIAERSEPDPEWPGFAGKSSVGWLPVYDEMMIGQKPWARSELLRDVTDVGRKAGLSVAGSYQTFDLRRAIANTSGCFFDQKQTQIDVSTTMVHTSGGSGWARNFGTAICDADVISLAKTAAEKALRSKEKVALEPGKYTVLLEPAAVGYLLLFLGFLSFGGGSFNRKSSFMAGKIGEKVMNESITLIEDPTDPACGDWPFDSEGTPVQKVSLIEKGVARGVVHDRTTSKAAGSVSTGHASRSGSRMGPYPRSLHMNGGSHTLSELQKGLSKAIRITRFYYINYVNPMKTMVTGTTRDGTFLIENGKIRTAIQDMRFIESILDAFNRVEAVSSDTALVRQFGSSLVVPAVVIPDFQLTETAGSE